MSPDFAYDKTILDQLEEALSSERMSTYLKLADGDRHKAIRYYLENIALSEALYGPIQTLEVVVRNSLHKQLSVAMGSYWYESSDSRLVGHLQDKISDAKHMLTSQGKSHIPSRIIAELNFGFWIGILTRRYETTLWRPYLHKAFPNAPLPFTRAYAHDSLDQVRKLRNRIAHHEPILSKSLIDQHAMILKIISWASPSTSLWVEHHSRFPEVWKGMYD